MKRLLLLIVCLLLAGCATPPADPPPQTEALLQDALFSPPSVRIAAEDVFALTPAMQRYVAVDIAYQLRREGLQRGLIDALYRQGQLKLDYDATMTRNAAEAFEARAGNCLSLVIMTAAFAKELGLRVTYQSVAIEETWSRSDDIAFANGHVNLTLTGRFAGTAPGYDQGRLLTIDFLPAQDILGQRTREISEPTIIAMYMNNRAAEAMAAGELDDAYWWTRAALRSAPGFSIAHNTLGVIYLRHGDLQAAEQVLAPLLEREPRNTQALANLATVLARRGRSDEAGALRERLARIEPNPPYRDFRRGVAAMGRGDYAAAKNWFEHEVARADYNSEFHFWLGLAYLRLGELQQARSQLAIAMENSTTHREHDLYAAKLDRLRSQQAQ